ncbi:hypothetical protein ABMA28_004218 [Loxostege sticticalis]|uniref:Tetraspanin n=1 Tax=Loxostege sticticalis TaxID=481309 RepID=A0ABD0SVQ6_LOXSC
MFQLGGLVLLILGIIVQVQSSDLAVINGLAPISSIVVGSIIFVIAFFGCCGAIRENRCFLITYAVFMVLLMIVKIIIGVVIFIDKNSMLEELRTELTNTFENNRTDFLEIQSSFQCCGTNGPNDFLPGALPGSCCPEPPCNTNNAFDGCYEVLNTFFNTFWIVIGVMAFIIAAIELVAALFGFCLSSHVSNKNSVQVVNSS